MEAIELWLTASLKFQPSRGNGKTQAHFLQDASFLSVPSPLLPLRMSDIWVCDEMVWALIRDFINRFQTLYSTRPAPGPLHIFA